MFSVPPCAPVLPPLPDLAAAPPANTASSTTAIETAESHSFLFKGCSFHFTMAMPTADIST